MSSSCAFGSAHSLLDNLTLIQLPPEPLKWLSSLFIFFQSSFLFQCLSLHLLVVPSFLSVSLYLSLMALVLMRLLNFLFALNLFSSSYTFLIICFFLSFICSSSSFLILALSLSFSLLKHQGHEPPVCGSRNDTTAGFPGNTFKIQTYQGTFQSLPDSFKILRNCPLEILCAFKNRFVLIYFDEYSNCGILRSNLHKVLICSDSFLEPLKLTSCGVGYFARPSARACGCKTLSRAKRQTSFSARSTLSSDAKL